MRILLISFLFLSNFAVNFYLFLFTYEKDCEQEQFFNTYHLSDDEIAQIHDGDILLRHGFGFVSDIIVKTLGDEFDVSHCAFVRKEGKGFKVIHSVSRSLSDVDGVQQQKLKDFVRESHPNSLILIRFQTEDSTLAGRMSNRAQYYLDQRIPFDNSFDIDENTSFYCTELLWKVILDETGVDILKAKNNERKDHLKFDIFWDPEHFDVIINHHLRKRKHQTTS
ncbi:MAG: hypothetical protein KKD31_09390 [Bacteroidetes bacterium]|nr:hypothetical protein [Bacteroidota bacterium]